MKEEKKRRLEENFSSQQCSYLVFDKNSGMHECRNTENLTICFIMNPFEKIIKIYFLCQSHSDNSLRDYIFSYVNLSREILDMKRVRSNYYLKLNGLQYKRQKTNDEFQTIRSLNLSIKDVTKRIEKKGELKNKISNFTCRECQKEIKKGEKRIVIDYIHALGIERYYLYFCSNPCLVKWENSAKVNTPIIKPLLNY